MELHSPIVYDQPRFLISLSLTTRSIRELCKSWFKKTHWIGNSVLYQFKCKTICIKIESDPVKFGPDELQSGRK